MDYRKFLGKKSTHVLPYLGGTRVDAERRRLRVSQPCEPGWWRFEVSGRQATPLELAEPIDLAERPAVRGHLVGDWLFATGAPERLYLIGEEEPGVLAPIVARRWHSGELLFEAVEWEQEAEEAARAALEAQEPLGALKAVGASLRGAFGFALLSVVARERRIPVSPHEVWRELRRVATEGVAAAEEMLRAIEEHRQAERARRAVEGARRRAATAPRPPQPSPRPQRLEDRAAEALDKADASLSGFRRLGGDLLEVAFRFRGERFIAVVQAESMQVVDAGICLEGHDAELTLESLPPAIAEAIDTHQLYITRR